MKCSVPRAVAISLPAPIASTTARQNASSANASASTPISRLLAHPGDRRRGEHPLALLVRVFPGQRERHEIGRRLGGALARRGGRSSSSARRPPTTHGRQAARASAFRPWPRTSAATRGSAAAPPARTARGPAPPSRCATARRGRGTGCSSRRTGPEPAGRRARAAPRASAAPRRRSPAGTSRSRARAASAGTAARPPAGTAVRPSISTGTRPRKRARSSSTGCAERARFATHSTASFPCSRI